MIDMETRSLWSQVDGKAIQGSLIGSELTLFPFQHISFDEYKKNYPNGKLLKKPPKEKHGSGYASYFSDETRMGIFGRKENFDRLPAKSIVYGVRTDDFQLAVSLDKLKRDGYFVIENSNPPIVIMYEEDKSAKAYAVTSLPAKFSGKIVVEKGEILVEGKAASIEQFPLLSSFWFAWASFFPDTELIQ